MEEFTTYNPAVMGFILDLNNPLLSKIKSHVVRSIRSMESDDKAYIYDAENFKVPRWPGQAVAAISRYKRPEEFCLGNALSHTLQTLDGEDEDTNRFVFVVSDKKNFSSSTQFKFEQSILYNVRAGVNAEIVLVSFNLDNWLFGHASEHPKCEYKQEMTPEGFEILVKNKYKGEDTPLNYCKLDIQELRQNYGEKEDSGSEREEFEVGSGD